MKNKLIIGLFFVQNILGNCCVDPEACPYTFVAVQSKPGLYKLIETKGDGFTVVKDYHKKEVQCTCDPKEDPLDCQECAEVKCPKCGDAIMQHTCDVNRNPLLKIIP